MKNVCHTKGSKILQGDNMESKGHKYNKFLRRFRQKMKPSSKVYGKKDRRQNRNAQKGDTYEQ